MSWKIIRFAKEEEAAGILSVYEPYVRETAITFECETPSLDEFRERIREISRDYPYLVCLMDGRIAGYAYAHRQMERQAYQWNAELSVYIAKDCLRCGIGKALYGVLTDILRLQNVRNLYGGVTSPNANSEKLHESMGFKRLGVYHATGYKCGAWHDVAWFEKRIGDSAAHPAPFKSIREIDKTRLDEILSYHTRSLNT